MIDPAWARRFAGEWIAAWNAHDLERILSLYAEDFEMASPYIVERLKEPSGTLRGKDAVRPYWSAALRAPPPLRFELLDVFVGVRSITLHYRSVGRKVAAETLVFDDRGLVAQGFAHHGGPG
jgi:ketosteroid isomerase-like protein